MRLTFFGHSAWGIETGGKRLLIDPFPESDALRVALEEFGRVSDFILVTHGAFDHLGIAFDLMKHNPHARLVTESAVNRFARASGIAKERILGLGWNSTRSLDGLHLRGLETRHMSAFEMSPHEYITGIPLAFVISSDAEPDVRLLHLGDTSIFSDLALFGQLYHPTIALIGIGPAEGYLADMSPQEGAQAALWLGVDIALPMHYQGEPAAAPAFCAAVAHLPRKVRSWVPEPLKVIRIERSTIIEVEG